MASGHARPEDHVDDVEANRGGEERVDAGTLLSPDLVGSALHELQAADAYP